MRTIAVAAQARSGSEDHNVQIVLKAFDALFNKRGYAAAERYWSPRHVQHSAHTPPGRDGLFGPIKITPETLRYQNHIAAATGDFVILHGRFSGFGLASWGVAEIVRMEEGCSRSIGTSSRTRPRGSTRAAACGCSATKSQRDDGAIEARCPGLS
jgi:predicted SnoaL-like aldol condensation-catalyzing enzyme